MHNIAVSGVEQREFIYQLTNTMEVLVVYILICGKPLNTLHLVTLGYAAILQETLLKAKYTINIVNIEIEIPKLLLGADIGSIDSKC